MLDSSFMSEEVSASSQESSNHGSEAPDSKDINPSSDKTVDSVDSSPLDMEKDSDEQKNKDFNIQASDDEDE